jgi:predicted RNA-binding protein with PUA-like domain
MSDKRYWLMKSEPDVYGIDDLQRDGQEPWDGIRNYEARNFMRDQMRVGDYALFYHSNAKPPSIVGLMKIASEPYPDPTQFDPDNHYFDPQSSKDNPRWQLVDVAFHSKFEQPISRDELAKDPTLREMQLFKRNRLSITPVTEEEFFRILDLAGISLSSHI